MTDFKEQPDPPAQTGRKGVFRAGDGEHRVLVKVAGVQLSGVGFCGGRGQLTAAGSGCAVRSGCSAGCGAACRAAAGCQQTAQESGAQQQRKGADIFRCHKKNLRNWCPGKPPEQSGIYTLSIRSAHGVVNRSAQDEFQAAPVQDIQKCSLNFGQFHALTFSALARIIKSRQVNLSVRVTVRSGMSIRGKAATASLWFLCPFSFSQKLRHGSGGVRRCRL